MMPEIDENGLCEILEKFIGNAEKTICSFLDNEDIQEAVDCIEQIGESAADVVGAIKFIRRVASIPKGWSVASFHERTCEQRRSQTNVWHNEESKRLQLVYRSTTTIFRYRAVSDKCLSQEP